MNSEITSIADYLKWIQSIKAQESEQLSSSQAFFYRGHADESYKFMPSVYREQTSGKSYRMAEYHLYQELLRRDPDAFAADKTIFERLVRMQHYGLPTRLLDLTQNPLVALFFACENHLQKNGEVIFFYRMLTDIYYPTSIPEPVLAGLEEHLDFARLSGLLVDRFSRQLKYENNRSSGHAKFDQAYHALLSGIIENLTIIAQSLDFLLVVGRLDMIEKNLIPLFFDEWKNIFKKPDQETQGHEETMIIMRGYEFLLEFYGRFNDSRKKLVLRRLLWVTEGSD